MKYINTKTKSVIDTECTIKGGDWKPLEEKKEGPKPQIKKQRNKEQ